MDVREQWRRSPVGTGAPAGIALLGVIGLLAGLVRGLTTYAPTAWAAALELAAPGVIVGAAVGTGVGLLVLARRDIGGRTARPTRPTSGAS